MASFIILLLLSAYAVYRIWVYLKDREQIKDVTSISRGEKSEHKVILELIKAGIDPRAIFHDLYFRKPNGEYTQVDLAVATKAGIIVFEIKDYSGWIFGNENQKYWTQVLAYGREKHRFYNPIMQNASHIRTIRNLLTQNPCIPFYSVIVFFGSSELKNVTYYAENTYLIYPPSIRGVVSGILEQTNAAYGNKHEIMNAFSQAVRNGDDPSIVSSQINSAAYYSQKEPSSSYRTSYHPIYRLPYFLFRRKLF